MTTDEEIFCSVCDEREVPPKRYELGYTTCLTCGALEAHKGILSRANRTGIAYNKGGYQYLTDKEDPTTLGRK